MTPAPDGLSFETSLFVDSVEEEYEWLNSSYPGFTLIEQGVQIHNRKPFDVLRIQLADGATQTIYFDISEFYDQDSEFMFDGEL